jgi:phosphoribosylaminoimidazole-succinocarboxamide synthase
MKPQISPEVPITGVPLFAQGKVREMYDLGDHFLMVASDRVSAFDVVMPTKLMGKGKILNQLSVFWFKQLGIPSHFVTDEPLEYPKALHPWADQLRGRSMLVRKAQRFDVECVARGYLVGSGWKDYQATGAVCGHKLAPNLKLCCKLEPALFTPAAKNDVGHDENIDFDTMCGMVGNDMGAQLRDLTLDIYSRARSFAATKGIILADTKFEFGMIDGKLCLIDEVLTPDSSRYWPGDTYVEGKNQESFDKQYLRDWLETLDWNKEYPGPAIPAEVTGKTLEKYVEIFRRLVGKDPVL